MALPPKFIRQIEDIFIVKSSLRKSLDLEFTTTVVVSKMPKRTIQLVTFNCYMLIFNNILSLSYMPIMWKLSTRFILFLSPINLWSFNKPSSRFLKFCSIIHEQPKISNLAFIIPFNNSTNSLNVKEIKCLQIKSIY